MLFYHVVYSKPDYTGHSWLAFPWPDPVVKMPVDDFNSFSLVAKLISSKTRYTSYQKLLQVTLA